MSFIEQYMLQLNTEKRRWLRAVVILSALSLIVALVTVWNLRMTGVTIANSASCGYEEHLHTDECNQNGCDMAEHIHSLSCYSNPSADVETAEIWEASMPNDLGKYWSENLARIAISQLGMTESENNYIVADDGETKQGITRYGQWYGNPHGDWSAMFVAFCLHYADVPQDAIPWSPGVYNMMQLCADKEILSQPDDHVGMNGNILFLDTDGNGNADKMLIVTALEEPVAEGGMITAVGGDWDNAVAEVEIAKDDPRIVGYIPTAAVREAYLQSLPLYSIDKNSNIYTIDIYALPVDYDGNRITDLPVTELGTLRVNNTTKRVVADQFDYSLGVYHSAYFGTETSVSVDNISTVWRYQRWTTYYLAYNQTNGTQNQQWLNRADTTISLYLRYTPEFAVTFQSEGFDSVLEYVGYKDYPTETGPSGWVREGYTLAG